MSKTEPESQVIKPQIQHVIEHAIYDADGHRTSETYMQCIEGDGSIKWHLDLTQVRV